jgi:hypothetical protein
MSRQIVTSGLLLKPVNRNDVVVAGVEVALLEGLDPRGDGAIREAVYQDFGGVTSTSNEMKVV